MIRGFLAVIVAAGFASSVFADPWARFQGPNGTGISNEKNVPVEFDVKSGNNLLWKIPSPGLGNSAPIIWGKDLFVHAAKADGTERYLACYDTATGKEKWKKTISAKKAHIHTKNSWASATPATDGESIFVPVWDGLRVHMTAFDMKGNERWKKDLGVFISQHGPGASPVIHKDKVFLLHDMDKEDPKTKEKVEKPATMYAFDKKTGNIVWEQPRSPYRACYGAPFIRENAGTGAELVVTSTMAITGYDVETGKKNWEYTEKFINKKGDFPLRTISATLNAGEMIISGSGDGGGDRQAVALAFAGSGEAPKKVWENRKEFPYVPCLLQKGDHVFFVNDAGFAGCYEIKSGKQVWFERQAGAAFTASPVMIDGKIYAASEQGEVYVFDANLKFNLVARNHVGEMIRGSFAVSDGKLFIRSDRSLFCVGQK